VSDDDEREAPVEGDDRASAEPASDKAEAESKPKPKPKSTSASTSTSTAADGEGATADDGAGKDAGKDRIDLPKWNRARVKRKQVAGQEQDAFQASVRKAGRQAIRKAPVVLGLIMLVAAAIAGVVWWKGKVDEDAAEATRLLASAAAVQARGEVTDIAAFEEQRKLPPPLPLLGEEAERAQKAEKALGELAAGAGDTEANKVGDLLRAAQTYKDGKFTEAADEYAKWAQANADHDLVFLAREGRALALEASGDIDGALAELETLAGKPQDFYRDQALWHKSRILEAVGRSDEALEVYKQYAEEYPLTEGSIAKHDVVERLQELAPDLVPEGADAPDGLGGLPLGAGFGQ
jgi:hypothetical protein